MKIGTNGELNKCLCRNYDSEQKKYLFDFKKFYDKNTNTCKDCNTKFSNCISCHQNICLTCSEFYTLVSGICETCVVTDCKNCDGVNNESKCNICKEGYLFLEPENKCKKMNSCPVGYRELISGKSCEKCQVTNCIDCLVQKDQCEKCELNTFLTKNKSSCIECLSNCKEKVKIGYECSNESTCLYCNHLKYLATGKDSCQDKCPNGQYRSDIKYFGENYVSYFCENCKDPNCDICSEGDRGSTCLQCSSSHPYKIPNTEECLEECPKNKGFSQDSILKICFICKITGCQLEKCRIEKEQQICDGCDQTSTNLKKILSIDSKKCYEKCPKSQYEDKISSKCVICPFENCEVCDPNTCLKCDESYFGFKNGQIMNCITDFDCPNNFYINRSSKMCLDAEVLNCSSAVAYKKCTKCIFPKLVKANSGEYYGENCIDSCGDFNFVLNGVFCLPCIDAQNCKFCPQNGLCTTCKSINGKELYKSPDKKICLKNCPYGSWISSEKICLPCNTSNCAECSEFANECELCMRDNEYQKFLSNGKKLDTISELTNLLLSSDKKSCSVACQAEEYKNQNSCRKCLENCALCYTEKICENCKEDFFLTEERHRCIRTCPSGYFPSFSPNMCLLCPETCTSCKSVTSCTNCKPGFYIFHSESEKKCVKCLTSNGLYKEEESNPPSCKKCSHNCKTCSGDNKFSCLSCIQGMELTKVGSCAPPIIKPLEVESVEYKIGTRTFSMFFNRLIKDPDFSIENFWKTTITQQTQKENCELLNPKISSDKRAITTVLSCVNEYKSARALIEIGNPVYIASSEEPENYLYGNISKTNIYYVQESNLAGAENVKGASKGIARVASIFSMVMSLSSSIALIKIFQMIDYTIFFNVQHPRNLIAFIDTFSTNILNDIPNLFIGFTNDDCGPIRKTFIENEMHCQILANSGQLFVLFSVAVLLKLLVFTVAYSSQSHGQGFWGKFNSALGLKFFISIVDMLQLDIYLSAFVQIDSRSDNTIISGANFAIAMVTLICLSLLKIVMIFLTNRVIKVLSDEKSDQRELPQKYRDFYRQFIFLNDELKNDSFYSRYSSVINMAKDPIMGLFLLFFNNISPVQIGGVLLITGVFFLLELFFIPSINMADNILNTINLGIYTLTNLGFFAMALYEKKEGLNEAFKEKFFGNILIVLLSILIIFNLAFTLVGNLISALEYSKKLYKKMKKRYFNKIEPKLKDRESKTQESTIRDLRSFDEKKKSELQSEEDLSVPELRSRRNNENLSKKLNKVVPVEDIEEKEENEIKDGLKIRNRRKMLKRTINDFL